MDWSLASWNPSSEHSRPRVIPSEGQAETELQTPRQHPGEKAFQLRNLPSHKRPCQVRPVQRPSDLQALQPLLSPCPWQLALWARPAPWATPSLVERPLPLEEEQLEEHRRT